MLKDEGSVAMRVTICLFNTAAIHSQAGRAFTRTAAAAHSYV